jgi:RNA 2',3'-cyclic 3'-phosphodiesterase
VSDLPEQIRAFIAVRIPDGVRAQLADVQRQLKPALRDVSWTGPEAMHLTLQFLGDIESRHVPDLKAALNERCGSVAGFEVGLGKPGSFNQRVIWVGVERGLEPLNRLADCVRSAAKPFTSHEENRPFSGHATLGRLRRPYRGLDNALRKVTVLQFLPWTVREFELIRSELSPQGSIYTTLATHSLK